MPEDTTEKLDADEVSIVSATGPEDRVLSKEHSLVAISTSLESVEPSINHVTLSGTPSKVWSENRTRRSFDTNPTGWSLLRLSHPVADSTSAPNLADIKAAVRCASERAADVEAIVCNTPDQRTIIVTRASVKTVAITTSSKVIARRGLFFIMTKLLRL